MAIISLIADSTSLILNGTGIADFVEGDIIEMTPVNPVTSHVNGSGGSVNITERTDGGVHDLVFRVIKYSNSDIFMNKSIESQGVTIFNGSLKENYTKDGTDGVSTWILENGSVTDRPSDGRNNQDGNATMEYTIRFRNATRSV